jgi:hypothetical protein
VAIDQAKWLKEGDWKVPATTSPVNVTYGVMYGKPEVKVSTLSTITAATTDWGGTIGSTSQWATEYWHTNGSPNPWTTTTTVNWTNLLAGAATVTQITPDLSLDVPSDPTNLPIPPGVTAWNTGPAKNDYYAIRWRRNLNGSGGKYLFRLQLTGGAEVRVGGVLLSPDLTLVRPYASAGTASSTGNPAARTYYYTANVGPNTLFDIRFHHSTDAIMGGAKIDFGIAEQRTIAKASEYATKYTHLTKTSLVLDGYVTLPSGMTGVVSYDERWSLEQTDYATAYFSLDRGTTWTAVASTQHGPNSPDANGVSLQDWISTSYLIPNVSGSTVKIMLKWELDARTNSAIADGWLLDNVIFAVSAGAANVAPTSSVLAITTVANTASSNVAPTVTDGNMPLDSFDVAITSTPKRGAAVRTNVVGNTDTVRYTPFGDWTGVDNTMLYSVTDGGGLSVSGQQAAFTVNPKFDTGVDMGDTSGGTVGTVGGNTWKAQNASGISVDINGTAGVVPSVSPSVDVATDAMLRDYIKASNAATGLRVHFGVPAGMYSVYLYWVASETSAQTFDVYLQGGADVVSDTYKGNRVENNLTMGAQGSWVKTGPYTVKVTGNNDLTVWAVDGGIAALAGIEWYQGGDFQNYTVTDVNPVSLTETAAGSGIGNGGGSPASFTVTAYGNDIWNAEDGFRYVYKAERGDVDFVVKIDSATLTSNVAAKAGIMFRNSVDANATMLFFGITGQTAGAADAIVTQYRTTAGATPTSASENTGTRPAPIWLKVQKRGNVFDVFTSSNGVTYGSSLGTYTVNVGTNYLYGVAVSAHDNAVSASATFSGVVTTLQ